MERPTQADFVALSSILHEKVTNEVSPEGESPRTKALGHLENLRAHTINQAREVEQAKQDLELERAKCQAHKECEVRTHQLRSTIFVIGAAFVALVAFGLGLLSRGDT